MKLNGRLMFTGLALPLAAIAYACMRSGTSFPLLWVIIPGPILSLSGIWGPGEEAERPSCINGPNGACNICNKENKQK